MQEETLVEFRQAINDLDRYDLIAYTSEGIDISMIQLIPMFNGEFLKREEVLQLLEQFLNRINP